MIFEQTLYVIREKEFQNFFIASADLDHITHAHGVGAKEHSVKITQLDKLVEKVVTAFFQVVPDGGVYIFSDHGMANVHGGAKIHLEQHFGKGSETKYLYFIDSTILRVWCFDLSLKMEIEKYLNETKIGKVLDEDDRKRYGITSKTFGEIIVLINEGLVFQPSFWGERLPQAMHGYQPELENQQGFLASNQDVEQQTPLRAYEVFSLFDQTLC